MSHKSKQSCGHQNGYFVEIISATHTRIVHDGVMETNGTNLVGNITGYEYICADCGANWKFSVTVGIKPQWLARIAEQL